MPRSHTPYAPEFRQQMIELVRAGRTPPELAREFRCSSQAIRNWVRQADADTGKKGTTSSILTTAERLRRQVRQLQTERDILAKATAWFAGKNGISSNS